MPVHEDLAEVLGDFARTLLTDFPIQAILDELVERIVDVLPIEAAGVTLISPGVSPRLMAASSDEALLFQRLQSELNDGPCLAAYATGEPMSIADLRDDQRFTEFSRQAVDDGLMAVFTFPLRHGDERLGALDLYRMTPGPLDDEALAAAQILADVAAAYLINARARSEMRESSSRAQHVALHDPLTGLPNRILLIERLEQAIVRCERSERSVVILYVDLDRFKAVNDTYGHAMGDELLKAVAGRLVELFRPADTVARLAGDEFVILCEEFADSSYAELLAERIQLALGTPFEVCGVDLHVNASVGIAFAGPGSDVPEQVLEDADSAMYLAKCKGGGRHTRLDIREYSTASRRTNLNHDLRGALGRDEIYCDYQPIVAADGGAVVGAEALVRWAHPTQGIVGPDTLIPLAEHSGLINPIGRWVLAQACEDRNRWIGHLDAAPFQISVNVSARQLMSTGYVADVEEVLRETATDPRHVTLEITESVFVHDVERVLRVLHELKALGVLIALDDFGTGYSSLGYLKQFPVDIVKIDRLFVADIDHDRDSRLIVGTVISLAHKLHMSVVAEGVESMAQYRTAADLFCDECQGFLFAHPMSSEAFQEMMNSPMAAAGNPAWRRSGFDLLTGDAAVVSRVFEQN